jgi:hypothetical protein
VDVDAELHVDDEIIILYFFIDDQLLLLGIENSRHNMSILDSSIIENQQYSTINETFIVFYQSLIHWSSKINDPL